MKKMPQFLIFILLFNTHVINAQTPDTLVLKQNMKGAAKSQLICSWGSAKYMQLHTNKRIYRFKRGLEDGMYIATFDKDLSWEKPIKDTAMVVVMENGELNGLLRRWDDEDKMIAEECEYKDGLMHGYRKLYFFAPDGKKYTNIELYKNGLPVKTLQVEW